MEKGIQTTSPDWVELFQLELFHTIGEQQLEHESRVENMLKQHQRFFAEVIVEAFDHVSWGGGKTRLRALKSKLRQVDSTIYSSGRIGSGQSDGSVKSNDEDTRQQQHKPNDEETTQLGSLAQSSFSYRTDLKEEEDPMSDRLVKDDGRARSTDVTVDRAAEAPTQNTKKKAAWKRDVPYNHITNPPPPSWESPAQLIRSSLAAAQAADPCTSTSSADTRSARSMSAASSHESKKGKTWSVSSLRNVKNLNAAAKEVSKAGKFKSGGEWAADKDALDVKTKRRSTVDQWLQEPRASRSGPLLPDPSAFHHLSKSARSAADLSPSSVSSPARSHSGSNSRASSAMPSSRAPSASSRDRHDRSGTPRVIEAERGSIEGIESRNVQ